MRAAGLLLSGLVLCSATALVPSSSVAKVRVVPYSKAGPWQVRAVFRQNGPFDHCSANATYKSGTRVSIIVYASGNWRLWFAHDKWPDRGRQSFSTTLRVDGRTVLSSTGRFKNRNAYVDLGRDVKRVRALMRGRTMSVSTPAGTSSFSLKGTYRATRDVARCWTANYKRPSPGGGAFGSANSGGGGAFGGGSGGAFGGAATAGRASVMSRAETLELATRYLGKSKQPYSILPSNKNPLKHFPVNWRYHSGTVGGMKVYRNTRASVDRVLSVLLSDQAKSCGGRNASQKGEPSTIRGRKIARARGVCETKSGSVLNITYRVAELGRGMMMMIMEVKTKKGSGGTAQGGGSDVYVPAPNEL